MANIIYLSLSPGRRGSFLPPLNRTLGSQTTVSCAPDTIRRARYLLPYPGSLHGASLRMRSVPYSERRCSPAHPVRKPRVDARRAVCWPRRPVLGVRGGRSAQTPSVTRSALPVGSVRCARCRAPSRSSQKRCHCHFFFREGGETLVVTSRMSQLRCGNVRLKWRALNTVILNSFF